MSDQRENSENRSTGARITPPQVTVTKDLDLSGTPCRSNEAIEGRGKSFSVERTLIDMSTKFEADERRRFERNNIVNLPVYGSRMRFEIL